MNETKSPNAATLEARYQFVYDVRILLIMLLAVTAIGSIITAASLRWGWGGGVLAWTSICLAFAASNEFTLSRFKKALRVARMNDRLDEGAGSTQGGHTR